MEENKKRGLIFAPFFRNHTGNVPEHQELAIATTRTLLSREEGGGGGGGGGGSKTEGRSENRRKVENDGVL